MQVINVVLNDFTNDSRVLKTSKSLMGLGIDVRVVALHHEGLLEHDCVSGIEVHRIRLCSRAWSKHLVVQFAKFTEFAVRFVASYGKADVLHCNDLDGLAIGCICKLFRRRIRIVYDSHEFAINDVPYESKWSIRAKYVLERALIRFADAVISVSESIATEYARMYGIEKPCLVLNCPNYFEEERRDLLRWDLDISEDRKIFLYQGRLSGGRGIEIVLRAFEELKDESAVLVFMGYGPLEDMIRERARGNGNIFFHPAVAPDALLDFTASADYGISFVEDSCVSYRYCLPNKLFEYIMAGVPVLASNLVEMKKVVESCRVGVVMPENSVSGFRSGMASLLRLDRDVLVGNTREARRTYCWEVQERVLRDVYYGLSGSS